MDGAPNLPGSTGDGESDAGSSSEQKDAAHRQPLSASTEPDNDDSKSQGRWRFQGGVTNDDHRVVPLGDSRESSAKSLSASHAKGSFLSRMSGSFRNSFRQSSPANAAGISYSQRKAIRDAFDMFDIDGNGMVSVNELDKVTEQLFGTKLSQDDLQKMIDDVDQDNDGEINYKEFYDKLTNLIEADKISPSFTGTGKGVFNAVNGGDGNDPEQGGGARSGEYHWRKLGTLIRTFNEETKSGFNAQRKHLFENQKRLEAEKKKQELSRQHDEIVKHFQLRRMSADIDEDSMKAALRAHQANEDKKK